MHTKVTKTINIQFIIYLKEKKNQSDWKIYFVGTELMKLKSHGGANIQCLSLNIFIFLFTKKNTNKIIRIFCFLLF